MLNNVSLNTLGHSLKTRTKLFCAQIKESKKYGQSDSQIVYLSLITWWSPEYFFDNEINHKLSLINDMTVLLEKMKIIFTKEEDSCSLARQHCNLLKKLTVWRESRGNDIKPQKRMPRKGV